MSRSFYIIILSIVIFSMTACIFTGCGGGGGAGDTISNPSDTNSPGTTDDSYSDDLVKLGTFSGSATMDVWYKETFNTPAQKLTYNAEATITIDNPLKDDFGKVEDNPFHVFVTVGTSSPGTAVIKSANLYRCDGIINGICDYNLKNTMIQHWYFSGGDGIYTGLYDPEIDFSGVAEFVAEDVLAESLMLMPSTIRCIGLIASGSQLDIDFSENQVVVTINGDMDDPLGIQSCVGNVEEFELVVTAQL
jgi:hypothetical protein